MRLNILDMELILERHRKTVQRAYRFSGRAKMIIELLCSLESVLKEDLVQAIDLDRIRSLDD